MFSSPVLLTPARFLQVCANFPRHWRQFCAAMVVVACNLACAQTPVDLAFREFYQQPQGPRGPQITDTLRRADGQTVRLTGFMVQQEVPQPGRFMLSPRPVQMSEHADGDADDLPLALATVYLDPEQQDWVVPYTRGLIALTGTLEVGRFEEVDGRVSWVRLRLPAQATRGMNLLELAAYFHSLQHRH
jgi:hypothetical protein